MTDRDMLHLYPEFRSKVQDILTEFVPWCAKHLPGYTAALAEGFRSTERQRELYAQGRTTPGDKVTNCDGVNTPSNHQSCLAADIAFLHNGNLTWDVPETAWLYLQHLAHTEGLVSGHDWIHIVDRPHVEWPTSDHETYAEARIWKASQGLK